MILPETDLEQGFIAAERFRAAVEGTEVKGARGGSRRLTISAGVGCYPAHASNINELVELTDAALYTSKRTGRNRVSAVSVSTEAPLPPPVAAAAAAAATPLSALERLRRMLAEDVENPFNATRIAARMLHEASQPGDTLHILTSQLRQSSEEMRQELLRLMDDLSRGALEATRQSVATRADRR